MATSRNRQEKGDMREQLASVLEQVIHKEHQLADEESKDVLGYQPILQKRPNTRPKSGYKVNTGNKDPVRLSQGGTDVNPSTKELNAMSANETSGAALDESLTQHAAAIGDKATSKVNAAEVALIEGINIGRQQAEQALHDRLHQMEEKAGGLWESIKRHFANNKGKYGVAFGALATVAAEGAYATYRGRKGDQLSYMRTGEEGGVYAVPDQGQQTQGQATTGGGTNTRAR